MTNKGKVVLSVIGGMFALGVLLFFYGEAVGNGRYYLHNTRFGVILLDTKTGNSWLGSCGMVYRPRCWNKIPLPSDVEKETR